MCAAGIPTCNGKLTEPESVRQIRLCCDGSGGRWENTRVNGAIIGVDREDDARLPRTSRFERRAQGGKTKRFQRAVGVAKNLPGIVRVCLSSLRSRHSLDEHREPTDAQRTLLN